MQLMKQKLKVEPSSHHRTQSSIHKSLLEGPLKALDEQKNSLELEYALVERNREEIAAERSRLTDQMTKFEKDKKAFKIAKMQLNIDKQNFQKAKRSMKLNAERARVNKFASDCSSRTKELLKQLEHKKMQLDRRERRFKNAVADFKKEKAAIKDEWQEIESRLLTARPGSQHSRDSNPPSRGSAASPTPIIAGLIVRTPNESDTWGLAGDAAGSPFKNTLFDGYTNPSPLSSPANTIRSAEDIAGLSGRPPLIMTKLIKKTTNKEN
eukprot:TRINITY_DN4275_c1_g1_i1.p1 TRINITY_DN4275_c1_g1~~TRINITY_DN4275_c1_g1_i1.p1  ORF type:complete len:267 (+),score=38.24 TRINITY_DN4275_c1_g1_i1:178-978(+)